VLARARLDLLGVVLVQMSPQSGDTNADLKDARHTLLNRPFKCKAQLSLEYLEQSFT
jgi:hypothetical protein